MPVDPCGFALGELRACYYSIIRFPGVGPVLGRYYFTDKPYLPLPHAYGPWRWFRESEADADADDGLVGDITSFPWRFYSGLAPQLHCDGFRGSPEAWMGEDTGERYTVGGFPPDGLDTWDFLTMGG